MNSQLVTDLTVTLWSGRNRISLQCVENYPYMRL